MDAGDTAIEGEAAKVASSESSRRPVVDYQRIFETAPALFLLLEASDTFTILDASDGYLRATYTQREDIVGKPLFSVFPDNPEDRQASGVANLRSSLLRVLADGRSDTMAVQKYDIRRPAAEGGGFEERHWSPINSPVRSVDGRTLYILHRVEDVTDLTRATRSNSDNENARREVLLRSRELHEANRQLREATENFRAMYDQGLFAGRLRLDGTVADINRSAVEVCGFDRADILDRPFWECGWWNLSEEVQVWIRNAVSHAVAGEPFRGESKYFWADRSEHVVDFASMPIKDASGRVSAVLVTGMDITERVRAEHDQRILEAERRRAESLAEIDRTKTQFFSNISHEFRTPLTLILGPVEHALSSAAIPPELRADLELVQRSAERLLKLVNSLLDFARLEAGRIKASYAPVDLCALTRDLCSTFRSAMERASLKFEVVCEELGQPVYIDREMWEKIVLNLLSNAFKFTLQGFVRVRVSREKQDALLEVADSGVGIPASELPRLFERFYRVEGARGRTNEGAGIGLALVQELVDLHGGSVEATSRLGVGTQVRVRVPLGTAHLDPTRIKPDAPSVSTTSAGAPAYALEAMTWLPGADQSLLPPPTALHDAEPAARFAATAGARVLLADDNTDLRDYIREILRPLYVVEAVSGGEEALRAAARNRPDIIISDVMMPGLGGLGLLARVRASPALADVPVVLLSARAGEESRIEGLTAGADDYISKPFHARELLTRIGSLLEIAIHRKASARHLRELNANLEKEVAARTAELRQHEEALRQSQKMEAVGQLTGGLAHDFNNLLAGVLGSLELLQTRMAQGRQADVERYVSAAQGAARRAAVLTQRLLAFARRQTLAPKPADLNRLIAEMEELIQRTVGPIIRVENVQAIGLWQVLVDANQLENALLNLCINARDAMPGGGSLVIETGNRWVDDRASRERDLPPGQYVSMCVSDTGSGMSASVIARAFDPFFTTKPTGMGTGLGLSMVYGFARQSGGQARIYSELGKGTTVCLYFPRHLGTCEPAEVSDQAQTAPASGNGETVLVVDDEPTVRMLIVDVLKDMGYQALEAEDGIAGLQFLESDRRIDLLISDVGLPGGVNGRQMADAARLLRPKLKVLFITGYAENAVLSHGHLEPGMHVMTKPFPVETLTKRLAELLRAD